MNYLYFDCPSGVSGDMLLGAFLDDLVPLPHLEGELHKLSLENYQIKVRETKRHSIAAKKFTIIIENNQNDHRHLSTILNLINQSELSDFVKHHSAEVFRRLGKQEASIHGIALEKVHFHEVGAIDSIIDIVGAFICLEYLNPQIIYSSPLPISRGMISSAHGKLPVPAPATLALVQDYPLTYMDIEGELVTPTGAAILTHISQGKLPEDTQFTIKKIGYGAGSKQYRALPNLLRIWTGEIQTPGQKDCVVQIETNIDDLNPEIYPYLLEKLFDAGVLDATLYPNIMKKGRPGMLVSILCEVALLPRVREILYTETSTLGLRYFHVHREKLPRQIREIDSPWGRIQVKEILLGEKKHLIPEFEVCRKIARKTGEPLIQIYQNLLHLLQSSDR